MSNKSEVNCALCGTLSILRESHIVPKFVYKWMKQTGTGRLRQLKKLNTPIQDGIKQKLLCGTCENLFSVEEKWFYENIFSQYLAGNISEITFNQHIEYFSISVLWRVLALFINDGTNYHHKSQLNQLHQDWKQYLINPLISTQSPTVHLIFIPENIRPEADTKNYFTYIMRSVDIDIIENEEKCFIYAKFSRFIILGEVHGVNTSDFVNTSITINTTAKISSQYFTDLELVDYIKDRARNLKTYDDLSPEQQQKNDALYEPQLDKLRKSDYWKAMKNDEKTSN